jgi:hypothetical protein
MGPRAIRRGPFEFELDQYSAPKNSNQTIKLSQAENCCFFTGSEAFLIVLSIQRGAIRRLNATPHTLHNKEKP